MPKRYPHWVIKKEQGVWHPMWMLKFQATPDRQPRLAKRSGDWESLFEHIDTFNRKFGREYYGAEEAK